MTWIVRKHNWSRFDYFRYLITPGYNRSRKLSAWQLSSIPLIRVTRKFLIILSSDTQFLFYFSVLLDCFDLYYQDQKSCSPSRKTGKQQDQPSKKEQRSCSTMNSSVMSSSLFARCMAKVKVYNWFQLISLCSRLAALSLKPCFMVSWPRLKTQLKCLTPITRVWWSFFVSCTAMKWISAEVMLWECCIWRRNT